MTLNIREIALFFFACLFASPLCSSRASAQGTNLPTGAFQSQPELAPGKSPVAAFRDLLNMDAAERTKALADRSEETRRRILAKIREYQSLRDDERELRLRVTELGYYLRPLMRTPATNRVAQLASIPADCRE